MTVRMLQAWNGYYAQQVVASVQGSTEAALVAAGLASYDLDGESSNLSAAKIRTDSNGVQSLVDGAGNRVLTTSEQNAANATYILGDSLGANGWITTSNTYFALPGEGPLNWCNALLRAPFDIQGSVAASGKTLAQVITEQIPVIAALATKPRYAFISGGHNDLYSDSESAATVYARMVTVIESLLALGVTPIWSTVWARSYSALPTVQHMQLNDMLRRYAYLTRAGLFYDGFEATADQTTSITNEGRLPLASYYYDSSIHINNLLAFMVGKYMASRIGDRVFRPNAFAVGQEDATFSGAGGNLLANPAFRGTGGTVSANCTGTMPDSWTIDWATRTGSGSAAAAIVDFTDPTSGLVIGESIQVTISGTPAANDVLRITQASGIHGNLVGGNVVQAEGIMELASPAAVSECYIRAQTNTSEATNWGSNIQTPVALPATGQLYARTREMTVLGTGAASAARYDLRMKFNGNGSGTVLTFTRPRFRKVS